MRMMTTTPARKVTAATAGSGVAGAVAALLIWLLGQYGIIIPPDLQPYIVIIIGAVGALLSGYFTPPAERDQIIEG